MKTHIKLTYLYRDAGNYKLWNELYYSNELNISLDLILTTILSNLIEGEFFIPEKWEIPRLSFEKFDPKLDHSYHEFYEIEVDRGKQSPEQDIAELLLIILRNPKS